MTAPETTAADAFRARLTPRARLMCPRGQDVDALIWAALQRYTPEDLAGLVGGDGSRAEARHRANAVPPAPGCRLRQRHDGGHRVMALPWVRLDTQFATNPKILALVADQKWRAIVVYTAGLGYSGAHGTDGFLPHLCVTHLHGTKREAATLCEVGLWKGVPGGWEINGWSEFQQSSEEAAERKRKAKLAAEVRWSKTRRAEP